MADSFTIKIDGMEKLVKVFNELPKKAQSGINNEFKQVGNEWRGAAIKDAPADRARLRGSISSNPTDLSLLMTAQTEYAGYQEFGTGKQVRVPAELKSYAATLQGAGNSGVSPIMALTAWVKRKGLNVVTYNVKTRKKSARNKDAAAKGIAFAIFKKIKRDGLKPQSYLFTGKDGSNRVAFYVKEIKTRIAAVLQKLV